MGEIKICNSETGCFVCVTKSHFRVMYSLGLFPFKLECPKNGLKANSSFSIRYDKTGLMISLAHHLILTLFLIRTINKVINIPEDSPDLAILWTYLYSIFHLMALLCLDLNLIQTKFHKQEIQGLSKICETHSFLRPIFTKTIAKKLNNDTFWFLMYIIIISGSNFVEIFYNLIYESVTMDDVYFSMGSALSCVYICTKFYMFIASMYTYGYLLDEHHDYLKYNILEPKRTPKNYDFDDETETIATLSDYVDYSEKRLTVGQFVFVKTAVKCRYDIQLKMIQMRKLYTAIFFNIVYMNDYYGMALMLAYSAALLYAVVVLFAWLGIISDGYEVDFFISISSSHYIVLVFLIDMMLRFSFLHYKVGTIKMCSDTGP